MRPYQETITWLKFKVDVHHLPPSVWLMLGECIAEIRQLTNIPLPVSEARSVERDVLAGGIQARLALDGVPVSLQSVREMLYARGGSTTRGTGQQEVAALLSSWQDQKDLIGKEGEDVLDLTRIKQIHADVLNGTDEEDRPGHWRIQPTGGKPWEGVPPEVIDLFTEDLCDWLNSPDMEAPSAEEKDAYALLRMLLAELYLAWIRPFTTGHFRMAGAAGAAVLAGSGLAPVTSHLVSAGFNRNAREFQRHVQQASEGTADPTPFLAFALRVLAGELHELHARIRDLQMHGLWRAQLLELFQDGNDAPTRRQRQVLLDLADRELPVPLGRLSTVSPTLARLYAAVSEKTLRRDVDALLSAGVLLREPDGLRVHLGNILSFRP